MADFNQLRAIEDDEDEFNEFLENENMSTDDETDESISERLIGLTEMFPETVRKVCSYTGSFLGTATKTGIWLVRNALWIASSSAVILVMPVVFESERAQQQEEHLQQQRQILLGPNAAVSGSSSGNLLPGMNMVPPPPMSQRP
uniref:Mitochondrial import receptor subunit TOM22 homolog n=1 Tax=Arion vulgaris TaxID=1028688 RepID=A0A0B7AVN7_9EUPU